jgi:hypothetical protein
MNNMLYANLISHLKQQERDSTLVSVVGVFWLIVVLHNKSTMLTRHKAKKQGVAFRNKGSLYSQLGAIEASTRNGNIGEVLTQYELTEEEEIAATQKTPDAPSPQHLSQIQQLQHAHQRLLATIRSSSLESVASSDSEEESDDEPPVVLLTIEPAESESESDDEPEILLTRQAEPFIPHPHLVAQVKFENNASTNNKNKRNMSSLSGDDQLELMTQAILEETQAHSDENKLERLVELLGTGVDKFHNLDEAQKAIVRDCKRGSTSKANIQTKERMKLKMEDTIRDHGTQEMIDLLLGGDVKVPVRYNGYSKAADKLDYPMYNLLSGPRTSAKKEIINKLLTLAALTWKITKGKADKIGQPYQPITFEKYLNYLFIEWKRIEIMYDFKKDFNSKGQFHGVLLDIWKKWMKEHPNDGFGTGSRQATIDPNAHSILIASMEAGTFKPKEDPFDLLLAVMYINGRYLGFRGSDDHLNRNLSDLRKGVYGPADGPDLDGRQWRGFAVKPTKGQTLKLGHTKIPKDHEYVLTFIEDPDSIFNPVEILDLYVSHLNPLSTKFYAYPLDSNSDFERGHALGRAKLEVIDHNSLCSRIEDQIPLRDWPIWYKRTGPETVKVPNKHGKILVKAPGNIGKNKYPNLFRKVAERIGIEDFERCTGHAFRSLCITTMISNKVQPADIMVHARHTRIESAVPYARDNNQRKTNRYAGMQINGQLPTNLKKAPPTVAASNKKVSVEDDDEDLIEVLDAENLPPKAKKVRREVASTSLSTADAQLLAYYQQKEMMELKEKEAESLRRENDLLRENERLRNRLMQPPPLPSNFNRMPPSGFYDPYERNQYDRHDEYGTSRHVDPYAFGRNLPTPFAPTRGPAPRYPTPMNRDNQQADNNVDHTPEGWGQGLRLGSGSSQRNNGEHHGYGHHHHHHGRPSL